MIERVTVCTTQEIVTCDVTGERLDNDGWAIVRRRDGREVAHLGLLSHLRDYPVEVYEAAWHTSLDESLDEEEE